MNVYRGWMTNLIFIFAIFIAGCSGGGGDGGIDGSGLNVEGTAAVGEPLANAEIIVKGANGSKKRGTTDANGKFKINVNGLSAPYLLKVNVDSAKRLYSLAPEDGVNNIHPISDVVARNWFKSRDRDIDTEFDSDDAIENPPLSNEIAALIAALKNLLAAAYQEFSVDDAFNFQSTRFDADGTEFDGLLDHVLINIKQDRITIKLIDPDEGFQAIIILNFNLSNDLSDPDTVPPTTPSGLVAFPVSDSQVVLVWNPATDNVGVAGYRVYRNDDPMSSPVTTAFPVLTDTGLDPNTEYCYTVEAFDGAEQVSPMTPEVCVTPQPVTATAPAAVTDLTAVAESDTEIALTWMPSVSDDVIGYDILRGPQGQVSEKIATVVPSSYDDFNLTPVTQYCYIVQAFGPTGLRSDNSEEVCATTTGGRSSDTTPPESSANLPTGTYNSAQTVSLSCDDDVGGSGCAAIYYTTDGSEPTISSAVYSSAININTDTILRFFAVDNAGNAEVPANQEDYVISIPGPDTTAPVTSASPVSGAYNTAQNVELLCTDTESGCATIYYTTDGSVPDTTSNVYSTPIGISSTTTLRFFAVDNAGNQETPFNQEIYTITQPLPPLVVDISVLTHPVVSGGLTLYTITVGNTTNLPINNVVVASTVPAGLSFNDTVGTVPDPGGCASAGDALVCDPTETAQWSLGTLAAGGSRTISVNALMDPTLLNGDSVDLPVTVSASGVSDIQQIKSVTVNNNPSADLALSASKDPVIPGETFTLNVDVGSTSSLANVELRATLPGGVAVNSVSNGGADLGNGDIVWTVANLAAGESLHREVSVTTDGGLVGGQILHTDLTLTHDGGLAIDKIAEHVITVQDIALPLNVEIATSANPVIADDRVIYTITVSNSSLLAVDNVGVLLRMPAELSFDDVDDAEPNPGGCAGLGDANNCNPAEEVVWNLGTLAAGESRTINANALVSVLQLDGNLIAAPVRVTANNVKDTIDLLKVVRVNSDPAADLALSASTDPVAPGETFTFNVDLGNPSTSALANVELRATLPAGLTVNSISDGGTDMGNGEVVWMLTNLPAGESLHREVTVTANSGFVGGQILHAELALIHDGGLPVDQTTEQLITVQDAAVALNVDIATSANPVIADDRVLYTITVSNQSLLQVDVVNVLLRMPTGLSFDDVDDVVPDPGGCAGVVDALNCNPREEAIWNLGTLAAGESRTITANALVNVLQLDGNLIAAPVRVTANNVLDTIDLLKVVRVNSDPAADLALSASTDPVVPGETFTFNIDVGNTSASALTNVALRATLPVGVTIDGVSDGGTDLLNGDVLWSFTSLAVGESLHREVTVTADSGLAGGQILHADLVLTHDGGLPVDQTAEHAISVQDAVLPLSVDVATSADPVVANDRVLYTITVSNHSLSQVDGVNVIMRMPAALSFDDVDDVEPNPGGCAGLGDALTCDAREEVIWNLTTLAAGESRTITANALVDVLQLDGNLIATPVRVTAANIEDTIDLLKVVRVNSDPLAELALSTAPDPATVNSTADSVVVGVPFIFNIDMSNTSASALTNAELRATLPAGVTINSITNGGAIDPNTGEVVWAEASLAAGASLHNELLVTVTGLAAGDIVDLDVELRHDGGVELDNSAQFAVSVVDIAEPLRVSVEATPDPVLSGGTLFYTITVSNVSALPVDVVTVQFRVPEELIFSDTLDVNPLPGGCAGLGDALNCNPREEAVWSLGTLGVGASQVITIDATVAAGLSDGVLINVPIQATGTQMLDTINLQHITVIGN